MLQYLTIDYRTFGLQHTTAGGTYRVSNEKMGKYRNATVF